MKRVSLSITILLAILLSCLTSAIQPTVVSAAGQWQSLFDGKTLNGWIQRNGHAKYTVQDGCIVGTTVLNTPNSFLCTTKDYGDFILELDFKVDPGMNSGIQIRSHSYKNYNNGRVHGYQVEIDPSPRAWSGGIYDEARRGWLYPLKNHPAAQKAFKNGQWNHYRIEAIGNHIRTWVNGVPAADLTDDMTATGFIALQVHNSSKAGEQIFWRNIRIQDLDKPVHLKALIIDGQNNHNWRATTPVLRNILETTGIFSVDVATSPAQGQSLAGFKPDFNKYDVIVSNYNGADWPRDTQIAFEKYMRNGGGLVVYHAADNAFPQWKAYNEMIGVGGWGGRNEKSGPMIRYRNGKMVLDYSPGRGGSHGPQHEFTIDIRDKFNPIVAGLPAKWLHPADELYNTLRGPAKNIDLLATAYSPRDKNGTGENEPMLFTITWGRGRIFHTVLGHDVKQMTDVGFILTLQRGTEWAASGRVTQTAVPADFPTATKISLRPGIAKPTPRVDVAAIKAWNFDKNRKVMAELEEAVRGLSPEQLQEVEKQLLPILDAPDATYAAKDFVCRMLRRFGSCQSVPALARLLTDKKLSSMARFALQYMPCEEAGQALFNALARTDGDLRIGIIGSLGERRYRPAVNELGRYLRTTRDVKLARAIINALGQIGGLQSAKILGLARVPRQLRAMKADAYIRCADSILAEGNEAIAAQMYSQMTAETNPVLVRLAGYHGLIQVQKEHAVPLVISLLKSKNRILRQAAGKFITEMHGSAVTKALAQQLSLLPADTQIILLTALQMRADKAAAPDVAALTHTQEPDVQLAAIRALAVLGDASQVKLLSGFLASRGQLSRAAFDALAQINGNGVTAALVHILQSNDNPTVQVGIIEVLLRRQANSAVPALLHAAGKGNPEVNKAACKALGLLASPTELKPMLGLLLHSPTETMKRNVAKSLVILTSRFENIDSQPIIDALAHADKVTAVSLLAVLPKVADRKAYQAVKQYLSSGDVDLRKAAIRAFNDWPNANPVAALLQVMQTSNDEASQVLALRAYVKLVGLATNQTVEQRQKMYEIAMSLAKRNDEKKIVLAAMAKLPSLRALDYIGRLRSNPELKAEADAAYKEIGKTLSQIGLIVNEGTILARNAKFHGSGANYESASNRKCVGNWNDVNTWVSWDIIFKNPGTYTVEISESLADAPGSTYQVILAGQTLTCTTKSTGDWARFVNFKLGEIAIKDPGTYTLVVKPVKIKSTYLMNLRAITLKKK